MAFRRFRSLCLTRILFLTATIFLLLYLVIIRAMYATVLITGAAAAIQIFSLLRFVEKTNRDLASFLMSIKYSDFSRNFTGGMAGATPLITATVVLGDAEVSRQHSRLTRTPAGFVLEKAGIPVYIDSDHAVAGNNVMIVDRETVITGSFNFTKQAEEKNAENMLVLRSKALAKVYLNNFDRHMAHSGMYKR